MLLSRPGAGNRRRHVQYPGGNRHAVPRRRRRQPAEAVLAVRDPQAVATVESHGQGARDRQARCHAVVDQAPGRRSEEHTSELQSLMRISYAVFCLKKNTNSSTLNKIITEHCTLQNTE